jgi:DNA-binding CsgD family transcriptional regulator
MNLQRIYPTLSRLLFVGGILLLFSGTLKASDNEVLVREIEPLDMAEWFYHDEWPTQFLNNRWWLGDGRKIGLQPGFGWISLAHDSLLNRFEKVDLSDPTEQSLGYLNLARLALLNECIPGDKLLIALHSLQEGRLNTQQEWQLNWVLGCIYTQKGDAELSLYYLQRANSLAVKLNHPFVYMQSAHALFQRSLVIDGQEAWDLYKAYLENRDGLRAYWLNNQLKTDLAVGPPSVSESLMVQKALMLPEKGDGSWLWWPAFSLLALLVSSWFFYEYKFKLVGWVNNRWPGNQTYKASRQAESLLEEEINLEEDEDEEIPVDEEKVDQLNQLHLMKLLTDEDWQEFLSAFDEIYPGFHWRLRNKVPDISPAEMRLMCMIRLHLNSREISRRLGISQQSVNIARYRLRRKLGLHHKERLEAFAVTL